MEIYPARSRSPSCQVSSVGRCVKIRVRTYETTDLGGELPHPIHQNMTKTFVGGLTLTLFLSILVPSTPSRLVSIQRLPEETGQICGWEEPIASSQPENLFASIQREVGPSYAMAFLQQRGRDPLPAINEVTRTPEFRTLADTYPTYTSVGINLATDEVVLQDNNLRY